MIMNYEQHKQAVMNSPTLSGKFKTAVSALDDMDCVKALNYARTLLAMMENRVNEVQGVAA
jgi:hypothetical protein